MKHKNVKSLVYDSFSSEDASRLLYIGNQNANKYWEARLSSRFVRPSSHSLDLLKQFIHKKYVIQKFISKSKPPPHKIFKKLQNSQLELSKHFLKKQNPNKKPVENLIQKVQPKNEKKNLIDFSLDKIQSNKETQENQEKNVGLNHENVSNDKVEEKDQKVANEKQTENEKKEGKDENPKNESNSILSGFFLKFKIEI
eukprot:Anaeramoba_ignava/c15503_g1_i2.p1 GENE.c15503_g1_i2~~c15503_g1_i2.p1  ORF type:complete len:198 (+),score=84.53 c15503_g1_i2:263-856(+)